MSIQHHPMPVYQFQPSPKNSDLLSHSIPIPLPLSHSHLHNQIPFNQLPPTPPRSVASSPPLSAADPSLIHQDSSSNPLSSHSYLNGMPSRRHNYEMPATPIASLPPRFASTLSPRSPLLNAAPDSCPAYRPGYAPDPFRHPAGSSWDGTLSAALVSWLTHLRDLVAPTDRSGTLPAAPLPAVARALVAGPLAGLSPPAVRFGLLCGLWYSASALSSNTGKSILTRFRYPVTLTIVQFGFVAAWSGLLLALRARARAPAARLAASRSAPIGIRRPSKATMRGTCVMSVFSIAGHVFSSMAIARVPVSTVHTIKALSPLFTVAAYAGLFGVRYGVRTYISLLPLTLGVMLACSIDMRANGVGFLCALGSTVVFVSQNIFGKKMLPRETADGAGTAAGGTQMDKLTLLFYSSAVAFVLMVPMWAWTDAWALLVGPSAAGEGGAWLVGAFFCNGTVHFAQCILAFSILARTSPVTYSIASLVKRIAVICLAIVWFGQPVSLSQAAGMALTFGGLWVYNQAKPEIERGERRRGKVERRMEVLLPSTHADAVALGEDELDEPAGPRRTSLPTHTTHSTPRTHVVATQASNVTGNKTRHRAPSLSAAVVAPGHLSSKQNLQNGGQTFKALAVR